MSAHRKQELLDEIGAFHEFPASLVKHNRFWANDKHI